MFASFKFYFPLAIGLFGLIACNAPRSVIHSGKVTPKHHIKTGFNYNLNLPSAAGKEIVKSAGRIAEQLINKDSILLDEQLTTMNRTALAYSLDPFSIGIDFYGRYGVAKRIDAGYKYAGKTHVFDAMYQFMGSDGSYKEPGKKGMNAAVGLQFSSRSFKLPSVFGLDKVQSILGFSMKRKDILIPVIFSLPLGDEEQYGYFSFGLAYSHTFVNYGFAPPKVFEKVNATTNTYQQVKAIADKVNYGAYGGFVNLKLGYKYVFALVSLSYYYQNYHAYKMLDGSSVAFKGGTLVPTFGLQAFIPPFWKKKLKQS